MEEERQAAANLQASSLRFMKERLGSKEELQRAKEILEENKKNKAKRTLPKEINLEEEEAEEEPLFNLRARKRLHLRQN